jgi:hypothetical protein
VASAKVRVRLLLEAGSKPQEKRLVLPVFPFARFEAPPWPASLMVPLIERRGEESASRLDHAAMRQDRPPPSVYAVGKRDDSIHYSSRGMP